MKHNNILRIIALFAVCAASFNLFPTIARADTKGVHMQKTAEYDPSTKQGTITLQSFVEGEIKIISKATPVDVLLILDCTKSMTDHGDNFTPLKNAAKAFIDSIYSNAESNNINHRISIVEMRAPEILWCDFTSVRSDKSTLDNIITSKIQCSGGTTRPDRAFHWANALFNNIWDSGIVKNGSLTSGYSYNNTSTVPSLSGPQADAAKFIVFFTDGEPSSGCDPVTVMTTSKQLKDSGVTVFSVGLLDYVSKQYNHTWEGHNVKGNYNYVVSFLNAVSSNYPTAVSAFKSSAAEDYLDLTIHDYLNEVSETSSLLKIFQTISKEIKEATPAIQLGTQVTLKDFINKTYFKLPDNTKVSDIKTFTVNFKGFGPDGEYLFDESTKTPVNLASTEIPNPVVIQKDEQGNDYVSIKGFNFSANFCAMEGDTPRGKEILVEIRLTCKVPWETIRRSCLV